MGRERERKGALVKVQKGKGRTECDMDDLG